MDAFFEQEPKAEADVQADDAAAFEYLAIRGTAFATPTLGCRAAGAGAAARLIYNALVDRRVPFRAGVEHRLALAAAQRNGTKEPEPPTPADRFLPVPDHYGIEKEITALRAVHPWLASFPFSMLSIAAKEACAAIAAHVERCVAAKAAGRPLPRLRFRSARDGVSVGTRAFRLLRVGDGRAQPKPKREGKAGPSASQARNRCRRERSKAARCETFVLGKLDQGWGMKRIEAVLAEKEVRAERTRKAQREHDAERAKQEKQKRPRRDSPSALPGEDALAIEIQGLGRFRVRLDRPVPDEAEPTLVRVAKGPRHGDPIEVRLTVRVPQVVPRNDMVGNAERIHAAVRQLPANAPPLAYVEAARAAGLPIRGEDLNVSRPSVDDEGFATKPVRRERTEVAAAKALQQRISRKNELAMQGAKAKAAAACRPAPKKRPRPSNRNMKLREVKRRIERRWTDASRTRAEQDASRLVRSDKRRPLPILVATDPKRMVAPLLAEDGPAERRAKTASGETPTHVAVALPTDDDKPPFALSARKRSALRANLHRTRMGLRIDRVAILCGRDGVIHATPGHEGTTKTCPKCDAVEPKTLADRRHRCKTCGLDMDRDQASALVTLGRSLKLFRDTPFPDAIFGGDNSNTGRGEPGRPERMPGRGTSGDTLQAVKAGVIQTETLLEHPGRGPRRNRASRGVGSSSQDLR